MDLPELARRLKAARERKFASARKFAAVASISHSTVSRIEKLAEDPATNDGRVPSIELLEKWAKACGEDLDILLRPHNSDLVTLELSPEAATVGRAAEGLGEEDQALLVRLARRLASMEPDDEARQVLSGLINLLGSEKPVQEQRERPKKMHR